MLTIFIMVLSFMILLKHFLAGNWKRYPPGPWGFPVLGHLPFLGSQPQKTLHRWSRKYGDIFSIRMGSWPSVVITSKSLLRDALVTQADCFSDRPPFPTMQLNNGHKSLAFGAYTKRWKHHRRIANHILRKSVHSNASQFEDIIQQECQAIVKIFRQSKTKPCYPRDTIFQSIGSILYQHFYGQEDNITDSEQFKHYVRVQQRFTSLVGAGNTLDSLPWTQIIFPKLVKQMQEIFQDDKLIRQQNVMGHLKTFDPNNLRDAADMFIAESMKLEETGDNNDDDDPLTKEQLLSSMDDLLGAGIDTTSNTIQWFFLFMAAYPDIQRKVHREIETVVGVHRKPALNDRSRMPYTQATIFEVIRIVSVLPMGIPHYAMKDTTLKDFLIPKGTVLIYNVYGMMHDADMWTNPDSFCPERFLMETHELDKKQVDNLTSFGTGKRRCLGEFVAKIILFLVCTNVLQSLEIAKPPGVTFDFEGIFGLSYCSKPYEILFKR